MIFINSRVIVYNLSGRVKCTQKMLLRYLIKNIYIYMQYKVRGQFCSFVYDNSDTICRKDNFERNSFYRKDRNVFVL